MNYLIESVFVGGLSLALYTIIQFVIKDPFIFVFFILGVLKHVLGYYLGIQSAYCRIYNKTKIQAIRFKNVTLLFEGLGFVIIGKMLSWMIPNRFIIAFLTGALIHIIAEKTGIHKYFLKTQCMEKKTDKKGP